MLNDNKISRLDAIDWSRVDDGSSKLDSIDWENVDISPEDNKTPTEINPITYLGTGMLKQQATSQFLQGLSQVVTSTLGGILKDAIDVVPLNVGEIPTTPFRATLTGYKALGNILDFTVNNLWQAYTQDYSQEKPNIKTGDFFLGLRKDVEDLTSWTPRLTGDSEEEFRKESKRKLLKLSQKVDQGIKDIIPSEPTLQNNFLFTDLPQGFGSMTGFALAGMLGRGKGLSPGSVASYLGA